MRQKHNDAPRPFLKISIINETDKQSHGNTFKIQTDEGHSASDLNAHHVSYYLCKPKLDKDGCSLRILLAKDKDVK